VIQQVNNTASCGANVLSFIIGLLAALWHLYRDERFTLTSFALAAMSGIAGALAGSVAGSNIVLTFRPAPPRVRPSERHLWQ
jgi:hypothetical protein